MEITQLLESEDQVPLELVPAEIAKDDKVKVAILDQVELEETSSPEEVEPLTEVPIDTQKSTFEEQYTISDRVVDAEKQDIQVPKAEEVVYIHEEYIQDVTTKEELMQLFSSQDQRSALDDIRQDVLISQPGKYHQPTEVVLPEISKVFEVVAEESTISKELVGIEFQETILQKLNIEISECTDLKKQDTLQAHEVDQKYIVDYSDETPLEVTNIAIDECKEIEDECKRETDVKEEEIEIQYESEIEIPQEGSTEVMCLVVEMDSLPLEKDSQSIYEDAELIESQSLQKMKLPNETDTNEIDRGFTTEMSEQEIILQDEGDLEIQIADKCQEIFISAMDVTENIERVSPELSLEVQDAQDTFQFISTHATTEYKLDEILMQYENEIQVEIDDANHLLKESSIISVQRSDFMPFTEDTIERRLNLSTPISYTTDEQEIGKLEQEQRQFPLVTFDESTQIGVFTKPVKQTTFKTAEPVEIELLQSPDDEGVISQNSDEWVLSDQQHSDSDDFFSVIDRKSKETEYFGDESRVTSASEDVLSLKSPQDEDVISDGWVKIEPLEIVDHKESSGSASYLESKQIEISQDNVSASVAWSEKVCDEEYNIPKREQISSDIDFELSESTESETTENNRLYEQHEMHQLEKLKESVSIGLDKADVEIADSRKTDVQGLDETERNLYAELTREGHIGFEEKRLTDTGNIHYSYYFIFNIYISTIIKAVVFTIS